MCESQIKDKVVSKKMDILISGKIWMFRKMAKLESRVLSQRS